MNANDASRFEPDAPAAPAAHGALASRRLRRAFAALALLTLAASLATLAPAAEAGAEPGFDRATGDWHGRIDVFGQLLKIAVNFGVARGADGADVLQGTIGIPAQGAKGLPLDAIRLAGDSLQFRIQGVSGEPTFLGVFAGDSLAGAFRQMGITAKFALFRGVAPREARAQDPKPPFPYRSEDVSFESVPGVTLGGTITTPLTGAGAVAAVLVSGSGPQNRDEEIAGHRPFAVIADALSRAGVTVLRYDDRGVGASTIAGTDPTTRDFADDAAAAVRYLRGRPGVKRVGVIGHSEGGIVAQILCARSKDVDWAVMLAGPAVSGRELNVEQVRQMLRLVGAPDSTIAASARDAAIVDSLIERGAPPSEVKARIRAAAHAQGLRDSASVERLVNTQAAMASSAWFREFLAYDPAPNLRRIRVPVLAYFGGKDVQVPAAQNEAPMRSALASNRSATIKTWPGLNHLFQTAGTGRVSEYESIAETFNPDVLAELVAWVRGRAAK